MVAVILVRADLALAAGADLSERIANLLGEMLSGDRAAMAFGAAWIGGVLTAFTPCVYPLYPITLRYFSGGGSSSEGKVFGFALTYVAGMTLLYAALGTSFAALGVVFGRALGSPWVTGAFALIALAMAVSLLGAFTIQLPSSVATKLGMLGSRTFVGAFAMGLVSGLIAAPCTGPVLAVILALIARTGAIVYGFWLMLAFGFGVGTPLLVIAAFSHHLTKLPKSGPWMTGIKVLLASVMILVAAYFGSLASKPIAEALTVLPPTVALVSAVIGLSALAALLAKRVRESIGQVIAVAGLACALVVSALGGAHAAQPITWATTLDGDLPAAALASGKAMMIDFTAEWCQGCKELEVKTFPDPRVAAEAERFVAVRLDATAPDAAMNALFKKYGVLGLPTVVFIDASGQVLSDPRVVGYTPPERFVTLMQQVH